MPSSQHAPPMVFKPQALTSLFLVEFSTCLLFCFLFHGALQMQNRVFQCLNSPGCAQRKMYTSINGKTAVKRNTKSSISSSNSNSGSTAALRSANKRNNRIVVGSLCAASLPIFGMVAKTYYFDNRLAKCNQAESSGTPSSNSSTAEHVNDELSDHAKEKVMTILRSIHLAFLFAPALVFAPLTYLKS